MNISVSVRPGWRLGADERHHKECGDKDPADHHDRVIVGQHQRFAQPCDRLDELGLDFVVVYPTAGLRFPRIQETRPGAP